MAQIQSQIRLHVGSATLDPIPRLVTDDVAGGSHYADMYVDWSMHADVIVT